MLYTDGRPGPQLALFGIDITSPAGQVRVALSGEIDLSTVGDLESELRETVEAAPELLVLDLREVTFLDSSGLRLLLRLHGRQTERGDRLVIVQGARRVARVLELTGADQRLEVVADPSEVEPG